LDILIGFKTSSLMRLYARHLKEIPAGALPRALLLATVALFRNSANARKEKKLYAQKIKEAVPDENMVFVLGHWRSGTSHLHHLLTLDDRFTYPTVFDIYSPHAFLYTEPLLREKMKKAESEKRPMDNMRVNYDDPGEDEFALAAYCLHSPVLGWVFNRQVDYYDRFLTFENATEKELEEWKNAFFYLTKKLTVREARPINFKSPQHTARVGILAEMFPRARFVHIHRHPFDVFNSTVKLYEKTVAKMSLAPADEKVIRSQIIDRYKTMYEAYFRDVQKLPSDRIVDVSYEDLDENPHQVVEHIFDQLKLGDFEKYAPKLDAHLGEIGQYKKNTYTPVQQPWRDIILKEWSFAFKKWNYKTDAERSE